MIKQTKGKEFKNVPKSKLVTTGWYGSTKYDGNYVQVHKVGNDVKFYTSGGKLVRLKRVADNMIEELEGVDCILECEYVHNCMGRLGDRKYSARMNSYRTRTEKGLDNLETDLDVFRVFDVLSLKHVDVPNVSIDPTTPFKVRRTFLEDFDFGNFLPVTHTYNDLASHMSNAKALSEEGWEGLFIIHEDHIHTTKRVNNAIKLKKRPTATLTCISTTEGEGKYEGMIGALVLQDENYTVTVGSGLSDEDRKQDPAVFVGEDIEISYEQIMDTYIQPTFEYIKL